MLKVIYLSKINTVHIVNVSEVYYGWEWTKSKYPVNTSAVFPNEKCVYGMYLLHYQESIRKKNVMMMVLMGIFLNLRKLMGKQFYITLPLCLILFPTEL